MKFNQFSSLFFHSLALASCLCSNNDFLSSLCLLLSLFLVYFTLPLLLGIGNHKDFSVNPNRTYPTSCCESDITDQISISQKPLASAVVFRTDDGFREHQRNISDIAEVAWNHVIPKDGSRSSTGGAILNSESKIIATCRAVYQKVEFMMSIKCPFCLRSK
jgi:hypothetical protein